MQVKVNENIQKPAFKPVTVALNFDNKEDFEQFFQIMGYNESIPHMIAKPHEGTDQYQVIKDHCSHLLTQVHAAMREYRYNS